MNTGNHRATTPPYRQPLDKPFELFLLAVCVVNSISILLGGPRPQSIQAALPQTIILVWASMLLLGSALGLFGIFWQGRLITSYVIEQVGLILAGGATMIYATAVVLYSGSGGWFAASISAAFALACVGRALVIRSAIHELVAFNTSG